MLWSFSRLLIWCTFPKNLICQNILSSHLTTSVKILSVLWTSLSCSYKEEVLNEKQFGYNLMKQRIAPLQCSKIQYWKWYWLMEPILLSSLSRFPLSRDVSFISRFSNDLENLRTQASFLEKNHGPWGLDYKCTQPQCGRKTEQQTYQEV